MREFKNIQFGEDPAFDAIVDRMTSGGQVDPVTRKAIVDDLLLGRRSARQEVSRLVQSGKPVTAELARAAGVARVGRDASARVANALTSDAIPEVTGSNYNKHPLGIPMIPKRYKPKRRGENRVHKASSFDEGYVDDIYGEDDITPSEDVYRIMDDILRETDGKLVGVELAGDDGTPGRSRTGEDAVILRDMSPPYGYRASFYDDERFTGHQTFETLEEALQVLVEDGYHVMTPGSLIRRSAGWTDDSEKAMKRRIVSAIEFHREFRRGSRDSSSTDYWSDPPSKFAVAKARSIGRALLKMDATEKAFAPGGLPPEGYQWGGPNDKLYVDPDTGDKYDKKTWITHPERTVSGPCPICEPIDGETVWMNQYFDDSFYAPPVHPHCECEVVLTTGPVQKSDRDAIRKATIGKPRLWGWDAIEFAETEGILVNALGSGSKPHRNGASGIPVTQARKELERGAAPGMYYIEDIDRWTAEEAAKWLAEDRAKRGNRVRRRSRSARYAVLSKSMLAKAAGDSAGVFALLPEELAAKFPDKGEIDDMPPHVTVLFIGKDVSSDSESDVVDAVRSAVSSLSPFSAKLGSKPAYFDASEHSDGKVPAYMPIESPGLTSLHNDLKSAVGDVVALDDHFPEYVPHATLAYLDEGGEFEGEVPSGSWTVTEVEVRGFGEPFKLSLGASEKSVASEVMKRLQGIRDAASPSQAIEKARALSSALKPSPVIEKAIGARIASEPSQAVARAKGLAEASKPSLVLVRAQSARITGRPSELLLKARGIRKDSWESPDWFYQDSDPNPHQVEVADGGDNRHGGRFANEEMGAAIERAKRSLSYLVGRTNDPNAGVDDDVRFNLDKAMEAINAAEAGVESSKDLEEAWVFIGTLSASMFGPDPVMNPDIIHSLQRDFPAIVNAARNAQQDLRVSSGAFQETATGRNHDSASRSYRPAPSQHHPRGVTWAEMGHAADQYLELGRAVSALLMGSLLAKRTVVEVPELQIDDGAESGVAIGIILRPGDPVKLEGADAQGDIVTLDDIVETISGLNDAIKSGKVRMGLNHEGEVRDDLVMLGAGVLPKDMEWGGQTIPKGSGFIRFRYSGEIAKQIAEGSFGGVSLEGDGDREPIGVGKTSSALQKIRRIGVRSAFAGAFVRVAA